MTSGRYGRVVVADANGGGLGSNGAVACTAVLTTRSSRGLTQSAQTWSRRIHLPVGTKTCRAAEAPTHGGFTRAWRNVNAQDDDQGYDSTVPHIVNSLKRGANVIGAGRSTACGVGEELQYICDPDLNALGAQDNSSLH
ncbi:hypothetical protein EI94DRAFT_1696847 [Lactarius quietus]|nr:hypothetical protein EI94DRAFT_1696847 [Lactarius quietus]